MANLPNENFESGDFYMFDWQLDPIYPWQITTNQPYEGTYCMKSGGTGINNAESNMTITVNIPYDGETSFFSKISSEINYDYGRFYIDGIEMGNWSGYRNWTEHKYNITAGEHTFQWRYTKDYIINSNDDCFYVDYITFYRELEPVQPGWHTYCEDEFNNAYRSNVGQCSWGYEYPISLTSQYAGYNLTKVSLFSDTMYGAVGGNFTCNIYVGGSTPATGTLASTLTVDVPCSQGTWVEYDLNTPVNVSGNETIWVLWQENEAGCLGYPAGCSSGNNEYGNWWNAGGGDGWVHQNDVIWTMKNYLTNRAGCSVEFGFTNNIPVVVESSVKMDTKLFAPTKGQSDDYPGTECINPNATADKAHSDDRSLQYFRLYRACNGSGTTLIADNVTGNMFIDSEWSALDPGFYQYGVYALDGSTSDIVWSNYIQKPTAQASYQINAIANPSNAGMVTGMGTYSQGSTCTLTATVNEDYIFTNWTKNGTQVSTDLTYSFVVTEDALFVANFTPTSTPHHWTYNPNLYANNMNVLGMVAVNGEVLNSEYIEVGAFCGDECRGSDFVIQDGNQYLVLMTICGESGDMITFRAYDHQSDQEIDGICTYCVVFDPDALIGMPPNDPVVFDFVTIVNITQSTHFNNGWTWWSTCIEQPEGNGLTQLENGLGNNGLIIKTQTASVTNVGSDWYGTLYALDNASSYRIKTNAEVDVDITGPAVVTASHPVTLLPNWTWIGYPCSAAMSVATALADITPEVGNLVKSQTSSAVYLGSSWVGTLNTLTPGMGLMYKSNSSGNITLTFPSGGAKGELKPNLTAENNHWQPNLSAYPDNMTVIAVVEIDEEEPALQQAKGPDETYELAAFANGECRGSVKLLYVEPLNRYVAFLTVAGDEAAELRFGLFNTETGEEYHNAEETLTYESNAVVGNLDEPYTIHFRDNTGLDDLSNRIQVFPNPVERGQTFNIGMTDAEICEAQVDVINALGVIVETRRATSLQHGTVKAPNVPGVYTLRITVEGKGTCYRKLVVK